MSAAAMANWAAGSNGVGPGVKRRIFRSMVHCNFRGFFGFGSTEFFPRTRMYNECFEYRNLRRLKNDDRGKNQRRHGRSHEVPRRASAGDLAHGEERNQEQGNR